MGKRTKRSQQAADTVESTTRKRGRKPACSPEPAEDESRKESKTKKKRKTVSKEPTPEPAICVDPAEISKMPYHDVFHMYRLLGLKNTMGLPELNDVNFIVGKKRKEYSMNRLPLVSISKKLAELIQNEPGTKGDPIELETVSVKGFNAVLRFAYGYDPEVTAENVVHAANTAKILEVKVLEEKCLEYIKSVLGKTDQNLMKYLEKSTEFENHEIIKICFTSLQEKGGIPMFLASPSFCALPTELVNMILKLDSLPVEEPVVWETCQKWAEYQAEQCKTDVTTQLKKVYHNVRFPLCDPTFFSCKVVPTNILTQEEMLKLFTYLTFKAGNAPTDPFIKTPRILWDETEISRFSRPNGEWFHLDDSIDGLCFQVDKPCELLGVGVYCGDGTTKCVLKIFKGAGDDREKFGNKRMTIQSQEKSPIPHKLKFPHPLQLQANQIYELELDSIGPVSLKGSTGEKEITHKQNGLEITFSFSKMKTHASETNPRKGNLPSLYVRVFSGAS